MVIEKKNLEESGETAETEIEMETEEGNITETEIVTMITNAGIVSSTKTEIKTESTDPADTTETMITGSTLPLMAFLTTTVPEIVSGIEVGDLFVTNPEQEHIIMSIKIGNWEGRCCVNQTQHK